MAESQWQKFKIWMGQILPKLPGLESLFKDQNQVHQNVYVTFLKSSLLYLFLEETTSYKKVKAALKKIAQTQKALQEAVDFIFILKEEIKKEIEAADLPNLENLLKNSTAHKDLFLQTWQIFFPEGVQIFQKKEQAKHELLQKRRVKIFTNKSPAISNPVQEILFTSNVLLRPPLGSTSNLSATIQKVIEQHQHEAQQYWYDHPIPLDVSVENNEILYGLKGLEQAVEFEKQRGFVPREQKLTCVLSCSVTHSYLHKVAKVYVQELIKKNERFKNLNIFLFTETDCKKIINQILKPAAEHYLNIKDENFDVFGVDGEYGRHYTFLKAMAALWHVFVDDQIKATFKIDLDQVFPQQELVKETGYSAFEHFKYALWGSEGRDFRDRPVNLGMLAGALVNAKDIDKNLFTPDVPYPAAPQTAEEYIFFSRLPQALSTEVEMMSRYDNSELDGKHYGLQRIHVTGGTTGILVDALFKYRPFTPSFIGRAEDQAFLLSVFKQPWPLLRYVHQPGLIMRHDKYLFAQQAIQAAEIGKIVGDYVRLIYFSAYAQLIAENFKSVKEELDPFTGSFISNLPKTIVTLRFLLKGLEWSKTKSQEELLEFVQTAIKRLKKAIQFVTGKPSPMAVQIEQEKKSWQTYYQLLQKIAAGIKESEPFAHSLKIRIEQILQECKL